MAVVIENDGHLKISTMYRNEGAWAEHTDTVTRQLNESVPTVNEAAMRLAAARGLTTMATFVKVDGKKENIGNVSDMSVHKHIIQLLLDIADEYEAATAA